MIGIAYLSSLMGTGVLQMILKIINVVGAPMSALVIMGIFMPCINSWVGIRYPSCSSIRRGDAGNCRFNVPVAQVMLAWRGGCTVLG